MFGIVELSNLHDVGQCVVRQYKQRIVTGFNNSAV